MYKIICVIILFSSCLKINASDLDSIKLLKQSERLTASQFWYDTKIAKQDSITGFRELNDLLNFAKKEGDHRLRIYTLLHMANFEEHLFKKRSNQNKVINFLNEAQLIAENHELPLEILECRYKKCIYYYHIKKLKETFENFLIVETLFNEISIERVPNAYAKFMNLGFIYYDFNSNTKALDLFFHALQCKPKSTWEQKQVYTSIGMIYKRIKLLDSATYYFKQSLEISKFEKDSIWVGISSSNLGAIYLLQKKYDEALPLLRADVRISINEKGFESAAFSLLDIVKINLDRNNLELARKQLDTCKSLCLNTVDVKLKKNLYETLVNYYHAKKLPLQEIEYMHKFNAAKDSVEAIYDNNVNTNAQFDIESIAYEAKLLALHKEQVLKTFQITFLGFILFVLIILILILSARSKIKLKNHLALKKKANKLQVMSSELEQSNKELENLVFIASHDLQEPLRTMGNFLLKFENKYTPLVDDTGKQYIQFMLTALERMRLLIKDFVNYSSINRQPIMLEEVDMNEAFKEVVALLHVQVEESGVTITKENLPAIKASKTAMMQVLQNLINNAIKYRDNTRRPEVKISYEENELEYIFKVSDNGIGIEEKYFEKIFVIFQRLHTTKEYSGTGIGLALIKKNILRFNGKIWVESVVGKGSTFIFSIPK